MSNMVAEPAQGSVTDTQLSSDKFGVNVVTRPMGSHSQRVGAVSLQDNAIIREPLWDITKWVERPQVIDSNSWTTSFPTGSILASFDIPAGLLVNKFLKAPFTSFKYWRGDIELHLQTSGTPFHQGTIIMAYLPNIRVGSALYTDIVKNFSALTSIQHVILHANTSTSACMSIPFINPNVYIDIDDSSSQHTNSTGSIVIVVFNPLDAASGASTAINVSLVAQLRNSQFKVPRYQAEGLIEQVFGTSGGKFIQRMLPKNIIADSIDMALGLFGLDRPTSIERMAPMKMIGTNYMNSSVDIDYIDKLTLFPSEMQETSPATFGVADDEMAIDSLKRRFTYVGSFNQTLTDTPGTALASVPLSPMVVPLLTTTSAVAPFLPFENKIPLLEYISLPFKYWKGGLSFKIQVVATSFHNTRIFAAIRYGETGATPSGISLAQATNQYGFAFEVNQGSSEFEFTVPYVAKRHQLLVPGLAGASAYNNDNCMGTLSIYVLNELAVSNNVSSTITYNLFIAGASDFSLNTLSHDNCAVYPVLSNGGTFAAESLFSDPTAVQMQEDVNILSPSSSLNFRTDVNDKSVVSLAETLKKYTLVYTGVFDTSTDEKYQNFSIATLFRDPVVSMTTICPTRYNHFLNISAMYQAIRGPMRFKIVLRSNTPTASARVYYVPPFTNNTNYVTTIGEIVSGLSPDTTVINRTRPNLQFNVLNSTQKTAEIEIPYSTSMNYTIMASNSFPNTIHNLYGAIIIAFDKNTFSTVENYFDIYVAFGDETKFGVFCGPPRVKVSPALAAPTALDTSSCWSNVRSLSYNLTQL